MSAASCRGLFGSAGRARPRLCFPLRVPGSSVACLFHAPGWPRPSCRLCPSTEASFLRGLRACSVVGFVSSKLTHLSTMSGTILLSPEIQPLAKVDRLVLQRARPPRLCPRGHMVGPERKGLVSTQRCWRAASCPCNVKAPTRRRGRGVHGLDAGRDPHTERPRELPVCRGRSFLLRASPRSHESFVEHSSSRPWSTVDQKGRRADVLISLSNGA